MEAMEKVVADVYRQGVNLTFDLYQLIESENA